MPEITSCEDALSLLAAHLDGELDDATDRQLERHLEVCRSCYSRVEFERLLKARLADLGRLTAPDALSTRVRTMIREFAVMGAD